MNQSYFPTFTRLLRGLRQSLQFSLTSGPTWYSQPWYGDPASGMQESLLRLLSVAQREQLDVTPLITSLAMEHRRHYRRQLLRLAARIESGASLSSALEQTPDVLSPEDILAIRFASQSGTLGSVFDQLLQDRHEDQQAHQVSFNYSKEYWITLSFMILFALLFLMGLVAPTFRKLGDEMGVQPTSAFLALETVVGNPVWLALFLLGMLLIVGWINWFRAPQRFLRERVAPSVLRPVAERRLVHLYRLLASVLSAGRPLPGALSTLARYHFDGRLRSKLLVARNEMEQGVDVWQSLAECGMIEPNQAKTLQQTDRGDLRAWIFKRLASQKLTSISARTATLSAIIEPLLVLFFASLVLWICYAFFGYLVQFIQWQA